MFGWTADIAFGIQQSRDTRKKENTKRNDVWLKSMGKQKGIPQANDFSEHMPLCTGTNENLISKADAN